MIGNFTELIALIPELVGTDFGEWIFDHENDGTAQHPKRMPYVRYPEWVFSLIRILHQYGEVYPELAYMHYRDTLATYNIAWDTEAMKNANVEEMDAKGVFALLMAVVRQERFCDGFLLTFLKNGCILRWLIRLQELDAE